MVYDAVGGPAFMEALRACRPEGRLLAIGFASGEVPQIAANLLLVKNLTVIGLCWGGYWPLRRRRWPAAWRAAGLARKGLIRPHISHLLPFDQAPQALNLGLARRG